MKHRDLLERKKKGNMHTHIQIYINKYNPLPKILTKYIGHLQK